MKNFFKKLALVLALALVVTVVAPAAASNSEAASVALVTKSAKVSIGKSYDFNLKNKVKGSTYKWTSSNKSVATVNSKNGLTKGVKVGTATISCKITLPNKTTKTVKATITVCPDAIGVEITNPINELRVGQSYDFNRGMNPKTSVNKTYWVVKDETGKEVANTKTDVGTDIMSAAGVFAPKEAGEYTITAQCYRSKTATALRAESKGLKVNVLPEEAVVVSTKILNAEEIQVVFSGDVSNTATTATNYSITKNGTTKDDGTYIEDISVSKNIATIRLVSGQILRAGDVIVLQAKNSIKLADGRNITKYTSDEMVFNNALAPAIKEVSYSAANTLSITFDRPIKTSSITMVKLDGIALSSTTLASLALKAGTKAGNYVYTITLSTSNPDEDSIAKANGTHTLTLFDVEDTSAVNSLKASVLTASYTVTPDKDAPYVVGITAINANKFFIELSKACTIVADSLAVSKGNHEYKMNMHANGTTAIKDGGDTASGGPAEAEGYYFYEASSTYNNKPGITVVIADSVTGDINPLYKTGETSVILSVSLGNYKSATNLLGAKYTGNVTLSKADNKPVVESTSLDDSTGKITVTFTSKLVSTLTKDDVTIRNKNGVVIPLAADNKIDTATDKKIILDTGITNPKLSTDEPYTVTFAAGKLNYAADKTGVIPYIVAGAKNDTAITCTVKSADTSSQFKYIVKAGGIITAVDNKTITIAYGTDMDSSATNLANYRLDGQAFPTGTTADFVGDTQNVVIKLPASYVVKNTQYKVTILPSTVKTKDGEYVVANIQGKTPVEATITLNDTVAPTIKEAKYIVATNDSTETTKIVITFSEKVQGHTDPNDDSTNPLRLANFKVTVNGNNVAISKVENKDCNETIVITLGATVNVSQAATITISNDASGMSVKDTAGNALANDSVIVTSGNIVTTVEDYK